MTTRTDNERARRTAREAELLALLGQGRRRRKRLPRQAPPAGIARDYSTLMVRLLERAWIGLGPLRAELPEILGRVRAERQRFDAGEGRRVRQLLDAVEDMTRRVVNTGAVDTLARTFALRTSTFQRVQLRRQVRAALGADVLISDAGLGEMFEIWAAENAALIKSTGQGTIDEVARLTTRAVASGTLHTDLAKQIQARVNVGKARARLIARDQVGKLYGQVNAQRQRNMGVTHFFWRTSNDERVRSQHTNIAGNRYPLSEGAPGEGLPGEPVRCRCNAEPDFSGILGG